MFLNIVKQNWQKKEKNQVTVQIQWIWFEIIKLRWIPPTNIKHFSYWGFLSSMEFFNAL